MLDAPVGDDAILYDTVTEVAHVVNRPAHVVWAACDGESTVAALVAAVVDATSADPAVVERDVCACLATFEQHALVGRAGHEPPPAESVRAVPAGRFATAAFAVLDDRVAFRADDETVIGSIDELLVDMATHDPPTEAMAVTAEPSGSLLLASRHHERRFGSLAQLLDALPTELNHVAASATDPVALHAGAVGTPQGVVLLPAVSGSGKTTLTAALVRAGMSYVSDEAVGVRDGSLEAVAYPKPLVMSDRSRAVLGLPANGSPNASPRELRADVTVSTGDSGRIAACVLSRFDPDASVELISLEPIDAALGLLAHVLNLRSVGQRGLDAIVALAERTTCARMVHGNADDAAAVILDWVER